MPEKLGNCPVFHWKDFMVKFILGKKLEMTQIFNDKNKVVPVTLVKVGPCYVTQIKNKEKDGYESVQIGFEKLKDKKVGKSKKTKPYRYLSEFKKNDQELKINDEINVSVFEEGDKIEISGISKGKGFQGAVRRWGFHGRNATHGVKHEQRTLGSVGSAYPERVIKGRKMPGRMGADRTTVKNLRIVKIDKENNIIAVKGAVPGHRGTLLEIKAR